MSKEIGPREAALRKAREENYEREQARQRAERRGAPSQDTLKALNAKIDSIKPKSKKGKRK